MKKKKKKKRKKCPQGTSYCCIVRIAWYSFHININSMLEVNKTFLYYQNVHRGWFQLLTSLESTFRKTVNQYIHRLLDIAYCDWKMRANRFPLWFQTIFAVIGKPDRLHWSNRAVSIEMESWNQDLRFWKWSAASLPINFGQGSSSLNILSRLCSSCVFKGGI